MHGHYSKPVQTIKQHYIEVTLPDGGQHGDLHRDSFLSCISIIKHCRLKIGTMEQVPGLLQTKRLDRVDWFCEHFKSILSDTRDPDSGTGSGVCGSRLVARRVPNWVECSNDTSPYVGLSRERKTQMRSSLRKMISTMA